MYRKMKCKVSYQSKSFGRYSCFRYFSGSQRTTKNFVVRIQVHRHHRKFLNSWHVYVKLNHCPGNFIWGLGLITSCYSFNSFLGIFIIFSMDR